MDDEIDLDRVISDPQYRRAVIDRLNAEGAPQAGGPSPEAAAGDGPAPGELPSGKR